jgi:hypothetical protein
MTNLNPSTKQFNVSEPCRAQGGGTRGKGRGMHGAVVVVVVVVRLGVLDVLAVRIERTNVRNILGLLTLVVLVAPGSTPLHKHTCIPPHPPRSSLPAGCPAAGRSSLWDPHDGPPPQIQETAIRAIAERQTTVE